MPLIMLGIVLATGVGLLRWYHQISPGDPRLTPTSIVGSVLLGLGVLMMLSPFVLYWFIHGSHERYMWIIRGPAPFSMMGGGPFQLALMIGGVMSGYALIAGALLVYQGKR